MELPIDPVIETSSFIILLKSGNPDHQQNALKGLMFCSTACVVNTFLADDNLQVLVPLSLSPFKRVEAAALRLLWHLSAQAELKVKLYEEGMLDKLMILMLNDDPEVQLACSAILQNIAEHRFEKGAMNPNQVKIINGGILDRLRARISSTDRRIQFLACLTLCNLAMNEENSRKIIKSGLLGVVKKFVERSYLQIDMVCHWITLQPHIPLLRSIHPEVQLFGLSCLLTLSRQEQYKVEVWKALSMNDGVRTLFRFAKSNHHHNHNSSSSPNPIAVQMADMIISHLQLEEPAIHVHRSDVGADMRSMFNNPDFSDVQFVFASNQQQGEGQSVLYGHKAVLAARCDHFRAMFTRFRESNQPEIHLHDVEYSVFRSALEWMYTGHTAITRKNAVDLVVAADMYAMKELKQQCEFFLWHYIDMDNCIELYQLASLHHAPQLQHVCGEFISRNSTKLAKADHFNATLNNLDPAAKDELLSMVKNGSATYTDASGMRVSPSSQQQRSFDNDHAAAVHHPDGDNAVMHVEEIVVPV